MSIEDDIHRSYRHSSCGLCPFNKRNSNIKHTKEELSSILSERKYYCTKAPDLFCCGHISLLGVKSSLGETSERLGIPLDIKGKEKTFDTIKQLLDHYY